MIYTDNQRYDRIANELAECNLLELAEETCHNHFARLLEVLSGGRERHVCSARAALCYVFYTTLGVSYSYPKIGRLLEMHHTSVMAAAVKHAQENNLPHPSTTRTSDRQAVPPSSLTRR